MDQGSDICDARASLAETYFSMLLELRGRPLALYAPKQAGKTFFLHKYLGPLAESKGFIVAYVDGRGHKAHMIEEANRILEVALVRSSVPDADSERYPLPEFPAFRLESLVARIDSATHQRILLMIDDLDALLESRDATNILSALRAVLQMKRDQLFAVFTSSSWEGMATLFAAPSAPMYQFATKEILPPFQN